MQLHLVLITAAFALVAYPIADNEIPVGMEGIHRCKMPTGVRIIAKMLTFLMPIVLVGFASVRLWPEIIAAAVGIGLAVAVWPLHHRQSKKRLAREFPWTVNMYAPADHAWSDDLYDSLAVVPLADGWANLICQICRTPDDAEKARQEAAALGGTSEIIATADFP